jgi:hypothetical protein
LFLSTAVAKGKVAATSAICNKNIFSGLDLAIDVPSYQVSDGVHPQCGPDQEKQRRIVVGLNRKITIQHINATMTLASSLIS